MNRVWIPGWQFLDTSYVLLMNQLGAKDELTLSYQNGSIGVQQNISLNLDDWLESQLVHLPENTHLVGWSLGGMLACLLAKRSAKIKRVSVIAANTKFVGDHGLAIEVAENFMARYQKNNAFTRKRFSILVDSKNSQSLSPFLIEGDEINSLRWLYDINLNNSRLQCQTNILLASEDQLVPLNGAREGWKKLGANVSQVKAQHGLVLSDPKVVAQWLNSECKEDITC